MFKRICFTGKMISASVEIPGLNKPNVVFVTYSE